MTAVEVQQVYDLIQRKEERDAERHSEIVQRLAKLETRTRPCAEVVAVHEAIEKHMEAHQWTTRTVMSRVIEIGLGVLIGVVGSRIIALAAPGAASFFAGK
jgi:hypothetical protein